MNIKVHHFPSPAVGTEAKHHFCSPVTCEFLEKNPRILSYEKLTEKFNDISLLSRDQIEGCIADFCKKETFLGHFFDQYPKEERVFALFCVSNFFSLARLINNQTATYIKKFSFKESFAYASPIIYIEYDHEKEGLGYCFWKSLEKYLIKKGVSVGLSHRMIEILKQKQWKIETDDFLVSYFKDIHQELVTKCTVNIRAGDVVIHKGQTIGPRDLAILCCIKEAYTKAYHFGNFSAVLKSMSVAFPLALIIVGILRKYFRNNPPKQKGLFITIFILFLVFAKTSEILIVASGFEGMFGVVFPLVVPFSVLLFYHFLNRQVAILMAGILSFLCGYTFSSWDASIFIGLNFLMSIGGIIIVEKVKPSSAMACLATGMSFLSSFLISAYGFYGPFSMCKEIIIDLFLGIMSCLWIVGFSTIWTSILESWFKCVTGSSLLSLIDRDHQLLARLMNEAPGTYQHSLVVGQLSEAAAYAINANSTLCRVASYYHDIGKLISPALFEENCTDLDPNIHVLLTPLQSVEIIFSHVTEGIKMAQEHGLPPALIDIIREHHGTTIVRSFYCQHIKDNPQDKDAEQFFRYPGVKPKSPESTIIMMADAIEAASRSLKVVNHESVTQLIEGIIMDRIQDGQFSESSLSFDDLTLIKKSFVKTLLAVKHLRRKYPLLLMEHYKHLGYKGGSQSLIPVQSTLS